MRLARSIQRATLLAGLLSLAVASTALGHECYNASNSAQGAAAKAEHSKAWILAVDVRELIATGSSGFFSGAPVLDECQQEAFLAAWAETGLPLVFAGGEKQAAGQAFTIAGNNPNMGSGLGSNNQGIEHFGQTEALITESLDAAYGAAFAADCA